MTLKKTLLASVAAAAATLATVPSAVASEWYVNVAGGANWLGDNRFSDSTNGGLTTFEFDNEPRIGFVLSAAVGMHLNNLLAGLRVEGELGYRENDVNARWQSATSTTTPYTPGSVDSLATASGSSQYQHSTFSIMANAWYDFQVAGLQPYVGGGIGWANVDVDGVYQSKSVGSDFSESGFAWQLGGGLHLPIDDKMTLGIGYRYFSGPDVTIPAPYSGNPLSGDVDTENHSLTVGLTIGL